MFFLWHQIRMELPNFESIHKAQAVYQEKVDLFRILKTFKYRSRKNSIQCFFRWKKNDISELKYKQFFSISKRTISLVKMPAIKLKQNKGRIAESVFYILICQWYSPIFCSVVIFLFRFVVVIAHSPVR